ncbi:MAG: ComF family protein, partial [Gorillibacterium sp.]|nr:ComF family protein [Gorillibacterium sp.]
MSKHLNIQFSMGSLLSGFWAPSVSICITCGQARKGESNPLEICQSCFERIPWIINIQCPICGRPEICPDCQRGYQRYFQMNRSAVGYNQAMRDLLARYKYRGDEKLARLLGMMLYHGYIHLQNEIGKGNKTPFDCITYVPVSAERFAERGFNQAEAMALELAKHVHLPVIPLLTRVKTTVKQSQKSRSARFHDMRGAFSVDQNGVRVLEQAVLAKWSKEPSPDYSRKLTILLVDDV